MRLAVLSLACLGALAITPAYAQQGGQEDAQALRRRSPPCARRWKACSSAWIGLSSAMLRLRGLPQAGADGSGGRQRHVIHRTQVPGVAQPVLPQRDSVADPSTAASRPDSAAGPTDPDLKGFFAIPGTDTVIRIGGYAKLDAIADSRAAGDEDQFIPSSMPVGGSHRDVSNFNIHAKQTRFSFEARRPTTHGNLRFYLENDFFGSSDGYEFRLRHAYGQLGNTYAGYGYSSFMDPDSLPDTLDFAGPGGAGYLLVAGIHHSFAMGKGNTLTVAAEDPKTELAGASDERAAVNRLPDVTVTARMERDWGHLQLGAVARSLAYDGDGERDRRMAGGLQLSGSASVGERDLLLFGALGGAASAATPPT
jgi:hypothetical protein